MTVKDLLIECPVCNGKGTTVNPNIDVNGLSQEHCEDPEFMEDYMGGTYDITCRACNGKGTMLESHIKDLQQAVEDRRMCALEDGDWEGYSMAHDYRYGS